MKQSDIQACDVLLYPVMPQSTLLDKAIALGERILGYSTPKGQYFHVGIAADAEYTFEAVWPKTGHNKISPNETVDVYRLKYFIADCGRSGKITTILQWCAAHVGERYDLGSLLFGWVREQHEFICTQFVANAFASAQINMFPNDNVRIAPDMIADSPLLGFVGRVNG